MFGFDKMFDFNRDGRLNALERAAQFQFMDEMLKGRETDLFDDDDEKDESDGDVFEIQCPACGEDVMIDFDMIEDGENIICPNCHEEIELQLNFDDEDDEPED